MTATLLRVEEDDDEADFRVQCLVVDDCDPDPGVSSVISIPASSGLKAGFKTKNKRKLKFQLNRSMVTVEGRDPRWILE